MPEIARFYGIVILMFFGDHPPPHFHARYAEHRARVALDGAILDGSVPQRAERLIREWIELHSEELRACWDRAERYEPPGRIEPLP